MAGRMRASWPDRLRIQARVGAFWPVASIAVRADSAFVSLPRLQGYWAGAPTGATGENPAALASSLLWLLCPSPLVQNLEDPILERTPKGWGLRGRLGGTDPPLQLEVHLPENRCEIRSILFLDSEGRILLHAWRFGRKSIGEARIPESVRIETEHPRVRFEVRLLRPRRDPDAPPETFRITRPPAARWIPDGELLEMFGAAGTPR
jgi:hypothetical protein